MNLSLKFDERKFLEHKLIKKGYSWEEINAKINLIKCDLKNLVEKLKKKNLPKEEINKKFKEEFNKMCMKLEGEK